MEVILLELFLWAGLIFFFWALKDGLGNVEDDIENLGLLNSRRLTSASQAPIYDCPEKVLDVIGSYKDRPIFRYAVIQGLYYRFDHIYTPGIPVRVDKGARCLAPGLVYIPVDSQMN
jgi:hypothetical protein